MLSALRLGNFKAFAETQRMPIKPLTLVFGPNSAGKSSLIHALLLARHAVETGTIDVHRTEIGGESVDLGGFRQFIYGRNPSRDMQWGADLEVARLSQRLRELLPTVRRVGMLLAVGIATDNVGQPVKGAAPIVRTVDIEGDGTVILRMSHRPDGDLRLDRLNLRHPVVRAILQAIVELGTTVETVSEEDVTLIEPVVDTVVPSIEFELGEWLPRGVATDGQGGPQMQMSLLAVRRGERQEDLANAMRLLLPRTLDDLIRGLSGAIAQELARLRYLGPLRTYPPRHFFFSRHQDPNWRSGGGSTWDMLLMNGPVRQRVNEWLGSSWLQTPYEVVRRDLVALSQLFTPIYDDLNRARTGDVVIDEDTGETMPASEAAYQNLDLVVSSLIDGLQQSDIDAMPDLVLLDKRSNTEVSHRDVGIGISQVLPVLVNAYAEHNSIIAIEQPEIHLHPALQAELGDVFIRSALGESRNTFLLETHSEHLILRIMRRMRDTVDGELPDGMPPVRPEDVAVLYVQPHGAASVVRVLELNEEGKLLDPWPGGFFEDRYTERFS
jgi:hypothetical protein